MSSTPNSPTADLQQANADLQRQLAEARAERDDSEAQKAAIAEVLGVINSSPGDLTPVFDAMLRFLGNPQLRALARGRLCRDRLSAPELWDVLAVAPHDEVGEQTRPPGLMRCAEPLPGIGMEIFVEQQKILPVGGGSQMAAGLQAPAGAHPWGGRGQLGGRIKDWRFP